MVTKVLHYLPRVLTVIAVAFFYLFVLEGFSPDFGWGEALSHFILATAVLGIGILAWKKPHIGGWFFALPFSLAYFFNGMNVIFGSVAVLGVLYLIDGYIINNESKYVARTKN